MPENHTVSVLPMGQIWGFAWFTIILMVIFCIILIINVKLHQKSVGRVINKFKNKILEITNNYLSASQDILEDAIETFTCKGILSKDSEFLNKLMTTDKYELNVGIIPGYNHDNQPEDTSVDYLRDTFHKNLQDICKYVQDETGIYVSFTVIPVKTVYNTEWGCPIGGEESFFLSAIRNPKFCDEPEKWVLACLRITDMIKNFYNQSSVTGDFHKTIIFYDNGEDKPFVKEEPKNEIDN